MKSVIRRLLGSECPNCGKNSLSLYDDKNRKINYFILCKYNTEDEIKLKLKKSNLKYLKCDFCKSVYIIDWTKRLIPYPTTKKVYKEFETKEDGEEK